MPDLTDPVIDDAAFSVEYGRTKCLIEGVVIAEKAEGRTWSPATTH